MHLVFVTSLVPDDAPTTGYEIANAAIIASLRRNGAQVTVLGYAWPDRAPADPRETVVLGEIDVRTDTADLKQRLGWLARAVRTGQPFASAKLGLLSTQAVEAMLAGIGPFDAYLINGIHMHAAFPSLFHDRPVFYVAHNVEYKSAAENADAARSPVSRLLYRRESRLLRDAERTICGRAAHVFTLAEEDRADLGVLGERSSVLPLVTRAKVEAPAKLRRTEWDATLIGTWTWQPNRIGLDWFLEGVVPLLPEGLRIAVAGRAPAELAKAHPRVDFVGRVDDATDFVRSGAAVPLVSRAGTGVQLKTIETFELGLPAVATSRSLRGILDVPANCRVADDPADFAKALVETARDGFDLDGRRFHAQQQARLDKAIAAGLGLVRHGRRRQEAAA